MFNHLEVNKGRHHSWFYVSIRRCLGSVFSVFYKLILTLKNRKKTPPNSETPTFLHHLNVAFKPIKFQWVGSLRDSKLCNFIVAEMKQITQQHHNVQQANTFSFSKVTLSSRRRVWCSMSEHALLSPTGGDPHVIRKQGNDSGQESHTRRAHKHTCLPPLFCVMFPLLYPPPAHSLWIDH